MQIDLNDQDISTIMAALDLLVREQGLQAAGQSIAVVSKIRSAQQAAPKAKAA